MNRIIVFLPLFWAFQMMAQPLEMNSRKPDFKEIQKTVTDKQSPFFYEKLFKRYESGDTTLTTTEYWYLYYGYSFQSNYMPYQTIEGMEDFNKITKKEQLDEKDFRKIISIAEKEMKKLPFELDLLWYEYVAWQGLKDTARAKVSRHQFMGLVDAIIASGNGMSCETGFSVLYVAHEYVMLNVMGFQFSGKQSLTDGLCDKLQVAGNEFGIDELFFDVNRIFEVNMNLINGK
jgi:hypothetical protein